MVNHQEQEPAEDRVTVEGWLLIILVMAALVLSVRLQLDRSAVLRDAHAPGQAMEVTSSR